MIAPARGAAFEALQAVEAGRADLPAALAHARTRLADDRDRALVAELATGTLRWRAALDHVIAHASGRPLAKLDAAVLGILRLGTYQLLHLDRVPAAAVVDDAVQMTRKAGKSSASGLVNAVLRRISRTRADLPLPPRPDVAPDGAVDRSAALEYLSTALSHPRWLVERWLEAHGFIATEAWARFNNTPAPLTIRVNTLRSSPEALAARLSAEGVELRPTTVAAGGFVVEEGYVLRTTAAEEGLFLVQEEASQLVAQLAGVSAGERVLDTCAAPGGKTVAFAAAVGSSGLVVASDVRGRRIDLLRQTLTRAHATRAVVARIDLEEPLPFGPVFDCVFVDAPCSGLGTIRRDPEVRWRRQLSDLPALAERQARMLRHAAGAVRAGGRLVYATCSSEPEENEHVISRFLAGSPAFRPAPRELVASFVPPGAAPMLTADGHLRTWPWRDGIDAFFGAVLVRSG